MRLSQGDRNVSGTFSLGSIEFPSTGGAIGQDGSLQLNGTVTSNGVTIVVSWNLNMPGTSVTGTISQQWKSDTLSGRDGDGHDQHGESCGECGGADAAEFAGVAGGHGAGDERAITGGASGSEQDRVSR